MVKITKIVNKVTGEFYGQDISKLPSDTYSISMGGITRLFKGKPIEIVEKIRNGEKNYNFSVNKGVNTSGNLAKFDGLTVCEGALEIW